jgi:HK97 gp10 family phage protein
MPVIVDNNVPRIMRTVEANTRRAVQRAANNILTRSQATVPVDSGTLKASGETTSATGGAGNYTAEVSYNTNYAVYVELGTSKMGAQPYLVPAAHQALPQLQNDIRVVLIG